MLIAPQFLIIGGVAVVVGGLVAFARAQERKRRASYEEFSMIRGFAFEPERPDGERRFAEMFAPFNEGRRRTWGYTISGRKNQEPFVAFEYQWVTGSGKSSTTHRICGVVWERTAVVLPRFALAPEGWFSRLGGLFGMQDIDFDESPEFSREYRLTGPDEESVRKLFSPEIRQYFAATPRQHVAGGGPFLFWWQETRLPPTDHLDEWLEQSDHVRRRFLAA
jgi:hypothetical protein